MAVTPLVCPLSPACLRCGRRRYGKRSLAEPPLLQDFVSPCCFQVLSRYVCLEVNMLVHPWLLYGSLDSERSCEQTLWQQRVLGYKAPLRRVRACTTAYVVTSKSSVMSRRSALRYCPSLLQFSVLRASVLGVCLVPS